MRFTRALHLSVGALSALALVVTATAPASAHHNEEEGDSHEKTLDYKEAAWQDANLIAKTNRFGPRTALRFVENSRVFADFTTTLSQKYKRNFATAVYAENPGQYSVIRFKGEVPGAVAKQARELRFKVKLDGGAKYSAVEMQRWTGRIHDKLLESGFDQVVTSATPNQTIEATVYAEKGAKLPRLQRAVKVSVSKEPIAEDHHSRGGGNILTSTNFRTCTSGFSVVKNGVYGISTSGHCTSMDKYQEPDTLNIYETDSEDSHYGFWGDFQWQSSPTHIDPAEYFARVGEIRDVNSVSGWLPVNTPTCSFGRTTLVRNCDEVYSNFVIATFSGPTHWYLMANDNNYSNPGDSGGPISWATEADGLTKGSMTLGGARRQVWVRGSLMPTAIGATIRTK